jgi:hypothetical protein
MIRTVALLSALLCAGAVHAQTPAPTAAPVPATSTRTPPRVVPAEPSAYCQSGARAIFQGAGDSELAAVQEGCRRGDIIAISANSQGSVFAIGRLCDFNRAIVNAGGQILCSLTGTRGIR